MASRRRKGVDYEEEEQLEGRGRCGCSGCFETLLGGVPLILFLFICGGSVFVQESKAVCLRIAVDVMRADVREPGCVHDPRNDNRLVRMTCRVNGPGAMDPGTGLRTSGYRIYGTSRMLQWRVMQHYYHPVHVRQHNTQSSTNPTRMWCFCFERYWSTTYIEMDNMLQWHPRLCGNMNVNPGPSCEIEFPGPNPYFPDKGNNSINSLGRFDTFEEDVTLGEHGLRITPDIIEQIGGWREGTSARKGMQR